MNKNEVTAAIKAIIYGTEGAGVTTLSSSFPDPLFIDTDGGSGNVDTRRFNKPEDWTELLDMVRNVQDHPDLCQTLILDSADAAERLLHTCLPSIYGQDNMTEDKKRQYIKVELGKLFWMLDEVHSKGINMILTSHAYIGEHDGKYDLGVSGEVSNQLKDWADLILFCDSDHGERMIYTELSLRWDAWNCFGLPVRMPMDGDAASKILAAAVGESSEEDGLPDDILLSSFPDTSIEEPEELIQGLLRKSQKMMVAAPVRTGMTCFLMGMAIALAEGKEWFSFPCRESRVLYVNTDMRADACMERFHRIYEAYEVKPAHMDSIGVWNLRGYTCSMRELYPALLKRVKRGEYDIVIIDPVYPVLDGDERDAYSASIFCSYLDRLCEETGCAVIFSSRHNKGVRYPSRIDERIAGSGIWLRDVDAILDLSPADPGVYRKEDECHWRLESMMRQCPDIKPMELEFQFPVHKVAR